MTRPPVLRHSRTQKKKRMDLILDIGNTNITLAQFEEGELKKVSRFSSRLDEFSWGYKKHFSDFLENWLGIAVEDVKKIVVASVVPSIDPFVVETLKELTQKDPLVLHNDNIPELSIQVENLQEIGIDRLINAYAGYKLYQENLIIIDLGTATTFDIVTKNGHFLGGIISPGVKLSLDALIKNTGRLPEVEIKPPKSVIGKNTRDCIRSGITFGYTAMIEGVVKKIREELGKPFSVLVTGGLSHLINDLTDEFDWIQKDLTLIGLYKILNLTK